jgi:hypothetical protein
MNKMKFYSDGKETTGVKIRFEWLPPISDWDLFIYPLGLLSVDWSNYKIIGVDEV